MEMKAGLPPSQLRQGDYPSGPNGMAQYIEARMVELEEAKANCQTKKARAPINKHMHMLEGMLKWCKTRAGYR